MLSIALTCLVSWLSVFDSEPVKARVIIDNPTQHFYQVELLFPASSEPTRDLTMAVWTPGSYKIRDFARNVEQFSAFLTDGTPLEWKKTDKTTWTVVTALDQPFKVSYKVFAYEYTVRTSYLDSFEGFINPASVFLYETGQEEQAYEIDVTLPEGWSSVSALPMRGENSFRATSWDHLVDSPMVFGAFRRHDFEVRGIPHYWIISGDVSINETEMVNSLRTLGEVTSDIFGSFPFSRYYIFSHFRLDGAGGGLEHGNSTMVMGHALRMRTKRGWDRFLGLMIHEYFHAWNVKAIHDAVLGPFDYQTEIYTRLLWMHEGWTSYYDTLLMRRAKFWTEKELLTDFARQVDSYLSSPSTRIQSLEDASFNAWIHQYQPSPTRPNSQVSYYGFGAMSGLGLDLLIRHKTKNKAGLDQVMRKLYQDYALQGKGFTWDDLDRVITEVGGSGVKDFMETYIANATPMPFETWLGYAGLELEYPNPDAPKEPKEGEEAKDNKKPYSPNPKVTLDITTRTNNGMVYIRTVKRDGVGWEAGLDFGDEIISINGRRITSSNFEQVLSRSRPGDEVEVGIARAGRILDIPVKLKAAPFKLKLVPIKEMSSLQESIYQSLFRIDPAPEEKEKDE